MNDIVHFLARHEMWLQVTRLRTIMTFGIVAAIVFFLVRRFLRWHHLVRQINLARITPEELRRKLNAHQDMLLVDLQGGASSDTERMAIPGAIRIDPRALEKCRDVDIATSREVVLYGASAGEFTNARVALASHQKGIENVRPLAGGLQAWRDRGFPIASDVLVPSSPADAAVLAAGHHKSSA